MSDNSDKTTLLTNIELRENGDLINYDGHIIAHLAEGIDFNSVHIAINEQRFKTIIDTCDFGHNFAKLSDHPLKDGRPRCPYCLAKGLDSTRKELDDLRNELHQQALEKDLLD